MRNHQKHLAVELSYLDEIADMPRVKSIAPLDELVKLADERVAEEVERRRIEQEKERQAAVKISTEN